LSLPKVFYSDPLTFLYSCAVAVYDDKCQGMTIVPKAHP
jgi:hypothetical protein